MKDKGKLHMINSNNNLYEDNGLTDFEKMIMKWTAFDHYCPSIKAEVIWDMMLSEFIVDMVAYAYREKYGKQYKANNFYLLAKEFPIKSEEEENEKQEDDNKKQKDSLSCSKVDYLIAFEEDNTPEKKVILVELKTTPGSVSRKQLERYKNCDVKKLFDFYNELIKKKVNRKIFEKSPLQWAGSEKYTGQITYMFHQFKQFHREGGNMTELPSSFINRLKEMYTGMELFYLYVERVKTQTYNLSVQMEIKELKKKDENGTSETRYVFYDSSNKKLNHNFFEFMKEKYGEDSSKINAWNTFCKLIDKVNNYKNDFEEMKKIYEPNNRA